MAEYTVLRLGPEVGEVRALLVLLIVIGMAAPAAAQRSPHLTDLRRLGREPVSFVIDQLDRHDLIVFDDGLHTLVEPFHFYQTLLRDPRFRARARFVFLEVVSLSQQSHLEAYLASPTPDSTLLFPAFQNDLGGEGFPYATYFELLRTIHEVNATLPDSQRIRVVAVGSPSYWSEIRSPRDVELFRQGLAAYDYTMYAMIRQTLDDSGGKGIFLTNTRHAYQAVRHADGSLYWNATTYFHERDPGRAFSIRFHAPQLVIERVRADTAEARTTQGLERIDYHWGRMERGAWDRAFHANGDTPVAIPLAGTAFGPMADAYDAVIFLAPLERLHRTAITGAIYTPEFRRELARRLRLLYSDSDLAQRIEASGASDLAGYIERTYVAEPEKLLPEAQGLPPVG